MKINTVIHGDSLEIIKDFPDNSIDLILTDIPYNEVNRKSNGLRNFNKGVADSAIFDINVLINEFIRICKGSIYVFCGTEQISSLRHGFVNGGLSTRLVIWEKTNPSPINGQYLWLSSMETCVYAKKKNATFNEFCKSPVFRYSIDYESEHPTPKPIKLFERLLLASSNENDIVLDPFAGGGTTGAVSLKHNRNYILIEKEKKYIDIINNKMSVWKDKNIYRNNLNKFL